MDLYNNMTIKLISEIIDLTDGKQITMEYMTEEFIANITKMIQPLEYVFNSFYDLKIINVA